MQKLEPKVYCCSNPNSYSGLGIDTQRGKEIIDFDGSLKETEVQKYFFTKDLKKHDDFKNDIKSF